MKDWVDEEFATADLGDPRLNQRLGLIARRLADTPTRSVASAVRGATEMHGAYRFFDNAKATVEKVLAPHRDATVLRAKQCPRVLLVQDTTELDYTRKKQLKGAGPLAEGPRTGFFAHNHLVLSAEGLALGVWGTDFIAREHGQTGKSKLRRHLPIEEKESQRWIEGYHSACELARQVPGTQVVSCSDREGDIYELFDAWASAPGQGECRADWLVRSCYNRCMSAEQSPFSKIYEAVDGQPTGGTVKLKVKARIQSKKDKNGSRVKYKRSARDAILEVRWTSVELKPPYRKDRELTPVTVQVVRVTERKPPEGEDPIDWILLTSLEVNNFEDASEIIELYRTRWQIEVFHRVLKTGCRVEELQLKDSRRVYVAIAIYMVVAWRVLYLMKLGRSSPELPCEHFVEEDEWRALQAVYSGSHEEQAAPSLKWFVLRVAELGGHLGRKSDGEPGPEVLWRGMGRLRDFTLAWQILIKGHSPIKETGSSQE